MMTSADTTTGPSLIGVGGVEQPGSWPAIQVFHLFRLAVALSLVYLYLNEVLMFVPGHDNPGLYLVGSSLYAVLATVTLVLSLYRFPRFDLSVVGTVVLDITLLTVLMRASDEMRLTLGILINAEIAIGSVLTAGRTSIFFAALATILLWVEHFSSPVFSTNPMMEYTQVGRVSATFFATALLGFALSRQIRSSEALASRRGLDLAKMEQLSQYVIQQMRAGVVVLDQDDNVHMLNAAARQLLGVPKGGVKQPIFALSPALQQQLQSWKSQTSFLHKPFAAVPNGPELLPQFTTLNVNERYQGTLVFLDDTTDLSQQAQQMKLASLGRLTASIAHEIRNPLGAISHASQLLGEFDGLDAAEQRLVQIIDENADKMNLVVKNILQLSRRDKTKPSVFRLLPWLQDFVENLHVDGFPKISINVSVNPKNTQVCIDQSQLHQVLTNLCENGLRYSDANDVGPRLLLRGGIENASGERYLEVLDFGKGVKKEVQERLFEPFFTTEYSGTGLGLYIARELCEANRARLTYRTYEHYGACFRISFGH